MKKIALVGCGRISKRHIDAISDTQGVEIVLVCDIIESRARKTAEDLGVPYVTDYRKIKNVDVISVLTPSGNHPQHAAEIAEFTDAPYIVCEKPISLTVREAHELFSRVDKAGKTLLPVYQNRYNPLIMMVKELIDNQKFGKVYQFICNILWNRNDAYFDIDWHGTRSLDGGVLFTQASHYVDMVHYFFGELVSGKGQGGLLRGLEVYDSISAVMRFNSGVVGSLNATVNVYEKNYETEFTLIAEKGIIRLAGTNLNTIRYWNVEGMERPDIDFQLDHIYGKGHNTMYDYIAREKWEMFPSREDILSGIHLMEKLSY
ncbi:MAG: Gfo/Idh/MocA family oxidoreductase [Candidatus Marinimicrobia bacterium]|nr:Gfo/Idh/MocA family oxidoreductase [Candidatus Neomarinimicrobiota bacterium]